MSAVDAPLVEVRGPSALGGDRRRFLNLTWLIATTDFKLTYFGSVLG
jgi:ABC-2 type transport system permease protein